MGFAERLSEVRKKRALSQEELANKIGTQGPAIGRYERGTAVPTIEVAAKLSKILEVSLDYLVGASDVELDANTLKLVQEVQALPAEIREKVFYFLDISIKDFKTRQAYFS